MLFCMPCGAALNAGVHSCCGHSYRLLLLVLLFYLVLDLHLSLSLSLSFPSLSLIQGRSVLSKNRASYRAT